MGGASVADVRRNDSEAVSSSRGNGGDEEKNTALLILLWSSSAGPTAFYSVSLVSTLGKDFSGSGSLH